MEGFSTPTNNEVRLEIGATFSDPEELWNCYVDHARKIGFPAKKRTSKKNTLGIVRSITYCCSCAGFPKPMNKQPMKTLPRKSKKCGCLAKMTARLVTMSNVWEITSFIQEHNHSASPSQNRYFTHNRHQKGENFPTGTSPYSSEMQTGEPIDVAGAGSAGEPIDAMMTSTSTNCLTVDSTILTISTSSTELDEAAKTTSSVKSPTVDSNLVPISSPKYVSAPFIGSTSIAGQGSDEEFELVDNFKIPKEYAVLYKKIFDKYGHMATRKVIKSNDTVLVGFVTSLLQIISRMEILRGVDLSEALLERWEGDIEDVENLGFNIGWLREKFDEVKHNWKSSSGIRKQVEIHKKELDATQLKYVGLLTRKEELQRETSEVIIQIRKAEAKILFEEKAIQQKLAPKNNFMSEPVLGKVLS